MTLIFIRHTIYEYFLSIFLQPSYLTLTSTKYLSAAQNVDILNNNVGVTNTINNWVAANTNPTITNLLDPLASSTALVLVNTITFKDKWLKPFGIASNGPFHVSNDHTVQACMMKMSCHPPTFKHGSGPNFQILELPYVNNEVAMYIIRPDNINGLSGVESGLTLASLNSAISGMTFNTVDVTLPKFDLEKRVDLKAHLQSLGMNRVFNVDAQLAGIGTYIGTGAGDLYVDFIQHQAIIKVDVTGTEASAATAVGVCPARRRRGTPVPFNVDRPFLFVLRERRCGSILFMGRVINPQAGCSSSSRDRRPPKMLVRSQGLSRA